MGKIGDQIVFLADFIQHQLFAVTDLLANVVYVGGDVAVLPGRPTVIFFRKESRPQCFFAPEEERILFSPATVEMAGIGIVANRESFDRLTPSKLRDIIREVADTLPITDTQ